MNRNILAFWRHAYTLTAGEFHQLDYEGLEAMAAAVTRRERTRLRLWLWRHGRPDWTLH